MATEAKERVPATERVFACGLLYSLRVGYWTGAAVLRPEDLGLHDGELPEALYALGRKQLVPKAAIDRFRALEAQGRRVLDTLGFDFPVGGRFVPAACFGEVDEKLDGIKAQYEAAVAEFARDYPALREEQLGAFEQALGAWFDAGHVNGGRTRETFVTTAMGLLRGRYPDADRLPERFSFVYYKFNVSFGGGQALPLAHELGDARREAVRKHAEEAEVRIREFLGGVVRDLRVAATEIVSRWSEWMAGKKAFLPKQLDAMRLFVSRFRSLNFLGDYALQHSLDDLERLLPGQAWELNNAEAGLEERLTAALGNVKKAADDATSEAVVSNFLGGARRIQKGA